MAPHLRIKGLRREDYKQAPAWFDALLFVLNQALGDTAAAINGGLTFAENFRAELKTVEVTMPAEFPTWRTVGAAGQPAFESSYTNFSASFESVGFRMTPDGYVELHGLAKQPAASTNYVNIFTLPSGYRPRLRLRFSQLGDTGIAGAANGMVVQVADTGAVSLNEGDPMNNGWLQLDGIRFQAVGPAAKPDAFAAPFPIPVKASGRFAVKTCQPVQVVDKTAGAGVVGPAAIDWQPDTAGIKLNAIWGLQPGRKYDVTLLMTAG